MTRALVTAAALAVAFMAGRATLRRRAVLLLGRQGGALAPAVLASIWLVGLLLGQATGSVTGMALVAAAPMLGVWALVRRRFAPLRIRSPRWTPLDWAMFLFAAVLFWSVDLWDLETHRGLVAQLLHGNLPPRAFNDPRFPLPYHAVYDALVAGLLRAAPLDLQVAMAVVSTACVALTLSNLQAASRLFFPRFSARPWVGSLARALFMFGFGPVFIRCASKSWDLNQLHGHTAQPYIELVLRRPAGLGMAFFTLALALVLPCYRGAVEVSRRRAVARLVWLVPALLVLPQMSEEATFFVFVYLLPLAVARRLPARTVAVLVAATLAGALQSGVVLGVLGHRAMATPTLHLAFPPRLPTWAFEQAGVRLRSREAGGFAALELGPVFWLALAFALFGPEARRRIVGAAFLAGAAIAVFTSTGAWKKSDLDRFFFYGTPPVFMLAASLPDQILRGLRRWPRARAGVLAGFGLLVCGPSTVWSGWQTKQRLVEQFQAHALGGDLRRNLDPVRPRELILTTRDRANEVMMAGFPVIAPFETNDVTRVTPESFDDYVSHNADRAVWLFLPDSDPRVAGREVAGRDGGYVLVRAAKPGQR